ncbi:MAG: copper chaperone PCu(A)C [Anaerolineae bacterium]
MSRQTVVLVSLFLAVGLGACGAPTGPRIIAEDAWARPVAIAIGPNLSSTENQLQATGQGMSGTGGVFMRLVNKGKEPDRLLGGKTDVAQTVEIHETVIEGGLAKMQMLTGGLELPARGEVLLEPGSYHLMLIGVTHDLKVADELSIELQFEKSGRVMVEAKVREP